MLLAAFCLEGSDRGHDPPIWSSLRERDPAKLREDGEALVEVAERGLCRAARDVSMPGVAGSLLQLLELAGCGATLDVDRLPRPDGVALERWLLTFPSFGFVLAAAPEHVEAACAAFARRGLACAPCGAFDDSRVLRLAGGGESAEVWDLAAEPLTRSGLSAIAMGWCGRPWKATASPSRCQPSDSKKATLGSWIMATIRAPPRAPAVATAKRTSRAPSAPWRASGRTARRSPFQSPPPQRVEPHRSRHATARDADRVQGRDPGVALVAIVGRRTSPARRRTPRGARRSAPRAGARCGTAARGRRA